MQKRSLGIMILALAILALAFAVGCNQNRAGNASPSSGSNRSADNTATSNNSGASQGSTSAKLNDTEKQLLQKVAEADKAEIEMGQLAQSNASSPKVKELGQKLADDHTQNMQQVEQIAQQKGVQIQDQEKPDEHAMKDKMEKTNGPQFDKTFLQHEREDHAKLLNELQQEKAQVQDPIVKSFLDQTITTVQQHVEALKGTKAA